MSDILKIIQDLKQFKIDPDKVHIEDRVFRLFSKTTVGFLFACAGLVTLQSLFGDKLKCILPPKEDVSSDALNQFCFIMSTYTVPKLFNKSVGVEVPHYGVGPHSLEEDEQKYHYYYQWVPIALFFQALSFLIPHVLWKVVDGNKIKTICNLDVASNVKLKQRGLVSEKDLEVKGKSINKAAQYFVAHISYNKSYAMLYILLEILNLVIVALNFSFTNRFLSGQFRNYGPRVVDFLNGDPDSDLNPMNQVFPKVAKCDFHKYGPSGNLIRYDIMCVLALNIINEKIYLFLWFWFVIMITIGTIQILYRLILFVSSGLRGTLLKKSVSREYQHSVSDVLATTGYPEWFILQILSVNIDTHKFGELCEHIKTALYARTPNGRLSSGSSPAPSYTKQVSGDDDAFTKPLV